MTTHNDGAVWRLTGEEIHRKVRGCLEFLDCKKGSHEEGDKRLLRNVPGTVVIPQIYTLASVYLHEKVAEGNLIYHEKDKENCDHDA